MQVDRRTLMKGMLATGALLAMGTPPWALGSPRVQRPTRCLLFLAKTGTDELFEHGSRAACAGKTSDTLQIVRLKQALLSDVDSVTDLLLRNREARWIAVMTDADAVIFLELARTAGARLLSMGMHASSRDSACGLRHDWATTGPSHGVGGLLAPQLLPTCDAFTITERFVQAPEEEPGVSAWSSTGFVSYRSGVEQGMHLHVSGISPQAGCRLLGLETEEEWTRIPREACRCEAVNWQGNTWIEAVGYAVTLFALGGETVRESCGSRAFVHQAPSREHRQPSERFVSFVMDL